MIYCFMMKYVDFVAVVVQPYEQIVIYALKGQQCIALGNALGINVEVIYALLRAKA